MQHPILTEVKPLMLRVFFAIAIAIAITITLNIAPIAITITITITITNKHERNGAVCVRCVCARVFLYNQYHICASEALSASVCAAKRKDGISTVFPSQSPLAGLWCAYSMIRETKKRTIVQASMIWKSM
jgi:uncharacterized protein (DUF2141 family)